MADIFALTQEALAGTDLELVDIERAPLGLLRVTIDRPDGVRIEDCELVSRQLSRVFDVENIDFQRLEVSSPGVDRPLKSVADFIRFAGRRVEIKLRQAIDSRKVYAGILQLQDPADAGGTDTGPVFSLMVDENTRQARKLDFTFSDVERAKLDPVLDFKGKKR
jgi:ribosome maturation factor RimP